MAAPKLKPYLVNIDLQAKTHDEAVDEIANLLRSDPLVTDFDAFRAALREREQLDSSYLSDGIAFPHARTDAVKEMVVAAGCSRAGVLNSAGQTEHLIFIIGPPKRMGTEYLAAVGALARLLKDEILRRKLLGAKNAEEFVFRLNEAK